MMFRRIFIVIIVFFNILQVQGNSKVDALRHSLYEAHDSLWAAILVNMAKIYQYERVDSCIFYARKASEKAIKTKQDRALIDAETLLSQIALEKKDYVTATAHQRVILEASLRLHDWDLAMENYNAIAQTWLLRNNYAEAVEYLKKGKDIARERNNKELLKYYYQALIDSYRKLHNIDAVCEYYPLLMEVNQQMDAEAYNNRIVALQSERENLITAAGEARVFEQTKSTRHRWVTVIIMVWAVLASLAVAAAYLYFLYRIKPGIVRDKKALKDVTHELETLKNNQGATFRFLTQYAYTGINNLQNDIGYFMNEQGTDLPVAMDSALNRLNNDVFAIYGFFQNFLLLLQAQAGQLKPELSTVNIPQLATNMLGDYEAFAMSNEIQLVNEVQNNTFAIADERLIDIVLRNMMSNAFKYAPRGGRITLGTKENEADMEAWVTDDGIGLTPEQTEKLFELSENLSLPGNPDTKGYGLGLAVCKALVETCKGHIWAETKPNEGFCIRFSLPKAKELEVNTQSLVVATQESHD